MKTKIIIKWLMYFLISITFSFNTHADSLKELVKEYIKKSENNITSPDLIQKILTYPGDKVLGEMKPYINDSSTKVQLSAIFLIYKVGAVSGDSKTRQAAINLLIEKLYERDGGIVWRVIDYLTLYSLEDFTPEMKYKISQIVRVKSPHYEKLILLTGYLQIKDLIYNYKKMVTEKGYKMKEKWAMTMAMARMGDEESIEFIKTKIAKLPVNDDVIEEIYSDLTYVRQKAVFDVLLNIIMSDEKNCLSTNPDNEVSVICAYKVIKMVGPYIKGFPVKTDETGEVIIKDYDRTLTEVREWIENNKDKYELITNIY